MPSLKYDPVDDDSEGELGYFIPSELPNSPKSRLHLRPGILPITFLAVAMFVLGVISALSIIALKSHIHPYGHYETGFLEEKLLSSESIQLEQVRFKSPVDFEPNGHEFLVTQPGDKAYVGDNWKEIDAAWEELLWGRYFSISEDEAKGLWGNEYRNFWDRKKSGYSGGFDMFHQLHCLNQIRQALHRDIYPEIPIHGKVHTEHCIDHLRQAIMCWGSTAIIPLKYFEGYNASYVKSDAVHTCRKFEPIRQFVSERFNGSLFVPRPSGWIDHENNAF